VLWVSIVGCRLPWNLCRDNLHLKRRFERDRAKLTAAVMNQK
jgi:hypothetical protein